MDSDRRGTPERPKEDEGYRSDRRPQSHEAAGANGSPGHHAHHQTPEAVKESVKPFGFVDYDNGAPDNAWCTVIVDPAQRDRFIRDSYVGVYDEAQKIVFFGRIVSGPFYRALSDAAEDYEVTGRVELLGRIANGGSLRSISTRPRPRSEVFPFPSDRLRKLLGIDGDFKLGSLAGHGDLRVCAGSDDKNFLPRNVGVFGTVGSGKSNTAQVLMEECIEAGWAVVLVDVEGEYVRMNEPTRDEFLAKRLRADYDLPPVGIEDFRVYVPSSGRSEADSPLPFKIPISGLDLEVVSDILEFSESEKRVFVMASEQAALYRPESNGVDDVVRPYNLQQLIDGLMEVRGVGRQSVRLLPMANPTDIATAGVLRSKLSHLAGSNMLDWKETVDIPELPVQELLVPGRLSVLDVSETDDRSRNLAIAYVLQTLFEQVIATPKGEMTPGGHPRPPVLVVIEEVHTFVSRAAAPKMKALLDNLQIISRRGRKRWMGLVVVSQQPNHVPDEIFELANTRFIHQIKSSTNLDPVKQTTGNVDESLWSTVPAIGPGRCVFSGAAFRNPLMLDVRPARSRRLLVT